MANKVTSEQMSGFKTTGEVTLYRTSDEDWQRMNFLLAPWVDDSTTVVELDEDSKTEPPKSEPFVFQNDHWIEFKSKS